MEIQPPHIEINHLMAGLFQDTCLPRDALAA
jgi:hypothetical protein